jgi:serine/threonine protein phosphatase 1
MDNEIKYIAFGDIHGCFKAAAKAVEIAEEIQAQAIFMGDYIDRGPSAVETLKILIKAKKQNPDWIFLRGNHDQMLLDLINGIAHVDEIGNSPSGQFDYKQTAKSFEEFKATDSSEQNAIVDFLNATKYYYEAENFIFCHALLKDTGESISEKKAEDLIWNYNEQPFWEGKTFVHGHALVDNVVITNRRVNLNTRCGYGGCLSGILLKDDSVKESIIFSITEEGVLINNETVN